MKIVRKLRNTTSSSETKTKVTAGWDEDGAKWIKLNRKYVRDTDGFYTDYTLYTNGSEYICMFGDEEIYRPDPDYADFYTDSEEEAMEWFDSYDTDDYVEAATDDELEHPDQEYDSAATSINSNKLPAIYRMVDFKPGQLIVDLGGGKFDNGVYFVKDKGATLLVYDPYNRSDEHNKQVLAELKENGGADIGLNSNVLNVIKEPEARLAVLRNLKRMVKPGGEVYITVYEGTGKGNEGPTKAGYQLNRKTADYLEEVQSVFPNAVRKGKLIKAVNACSSIYGTQVYCTSIFASDSDIDAENLKGMSREEIERILDEAPVGTKVIHIRNLKNRFNMDVHIEKRSAYQANYYQGMGTPLDFKDPDTFWEIGAYKDPYIDSTIYKAVNGIDKYYGLTSEVLKAHGITSSAHLDDDEHTILTSCPYCHGDRFNDKIGLCLDCGYDEKSWSTGPYYDQEYDDDFDDYDHDYEPTCEDFNYHTNVYSASEDLDGFSELQPGIDEYRLFRKLENGKGVWRAMHQDYELEDFKDKSFPITYDQALGRSPIDLRKMSEFNLRRKLGRALLRRPDQTYDIDSDDYDHDYEPDQADWNELNDVTSASYGGAYDVLDEYYFTRDDLVDFGEEVVTRLENLEPGDYFVNDLYMLDPKTIHIEVYCRDREAYADKNVAIDMRRIYKPSDLNKYAREVANDLYDEFSDYDEVHGTSDYQTMKKAYRNSRKFKSQGDVEYVDFINELDNKGVPHDQYDNIKDDGCTVFYDDPQTPIVSSSSNGREFVQTHTFSKQWDELDLSDEYLRKLESLLLSNPEAGDVIRGSNGARKLRVRIEPTKGKRGGGRIIYVDYVDVGRIYLLSIYDKSSKSNLSPQEIHDLSIVIRAIKEMEG